MRPLQPRERKFIAIGILAGAVMLFLCGLVLPLANGFIERAETRERLLQLYDHNQRFIGAVPAWSRQIQKQRDNANLYAITAPTSAAASEIMKERLSRMVSAQGGSLSEVQDVDAREGWVAARVEAQLTLTQMNQGFRQFQNQYPYAVIKSLTIAADQAFTTGRLAPMDIRLEVTAPFIPSAPR